MANKNERGTRKAEREVPVLWTIGHSNVDFETFVGLLKAQQIEVLADIRSLPGSRKLPHFNAEAMEQALPAAGITYLPMKGLGGRRKGLKESPNTGWRHPAFRGYADYMATEEFAVALKELLKTAARRRTAIMCAEAVPWRCHRNLVSDAAVLLHGWEVRHIMTTKKADVHKPMSFARVVAVDGRKILQYPADDLFAAG